MQGNAEPTAPEAPETLAWTARPANARPGYALMAVAGVSVTYWMALWAFGNPLMACAAGLAVLGGVAEGLFPIHCRITSGGATTRCAWQVRTIDWGSVKSVQMGADGVHISALPAASRLSRIRGVTLRFSGDNAPAVLAAVRRYYKGREAER